MIETYSTALWGILTIILTVLIQSVVAAASKASQPGAIPGKMDDSLSHSSFVFRANRTFLNSLESFAVILGAAFLAILIGANAQWTGAIVWIIALSRIVHMLLYYAIATEKNPSPRSYFYLIGLLATMALIVLSAVTLIKN